MPDDRGDDAPVGPGEEGRNAVQALRESFVDRWLGPWSSHPRMAVRRVTAVRRVGALLVAAVAAYVAWRVYQVWGIGSTTSVPAKFIDSARQVLSQRGWMLVAIAASLSATLTAGLTVRASLARGTEAPSRSPAVLGTLMAAFVAVAVALCMAVAWFSGTRSVGTGMRWWILVGAMAPVSLLLFWFGLFPRAPVSRGPGGAGGRVEQAVAFGRGLRGAITPVLLTASSLLLSPDIARPVSGWIVKGLASLPAVGALGKLVAVFSSPIAKAMGSTIFSFVGMASVTAIATLAVTRVTSDVRAAARRAAPARRGPGLFAGLGTALAGGARSLFRAAAAPFRWIGSLLARRSESPAPDDASRPLAAAEAGPELALRLQEVLRSGADPKAVVEWIPAATSPSEAQAQSPTHGDDALNWLFGGRQPTVDQANVLEAFDDRWREHALAGERGDFGNERQSHADLFVESAVDRATLSATLRACALFACVARGQRVLFLVGDEASRQSQVDELRAALSHVRFESMYRVGTLDPSEVARWCAMPSALSADLPAEPPDIIVATPGDYDRTLLSGTFDHVLIRAFLLSIEVIFVDGLQRLTSRDSWLLHLPFLLDKHRLLLRNENRAIQLVVGSQPISDEWSSPTAGGSIARQRLATRLFGGDGRVKGHFLPLRPAFHPRPSVLRVSGDDGAAKPRYAVGSGALASASRPGEVALLVPAESAPSPVDELAPLEVDDPDGAAAPGRTGGDGSADDALADGLAAGTGPGVLRVALADVLRDASASLSGVRYLLVPPGIPVPDLRRLKRAIGGRRSTTVVEFVPDLPGPAGPPAGPVTSLPVFVSAGAPAMFLPHLRSAVPAMRADAPTRREDFARFGLSWDEERWRSHASAMKPSKVHEGWHLQTDGDISALASAGDRQFAWPAVFVRRDDAVRWTEVRSEAPPDEGICLIRERDRLELGLDAGHSDPRRFAVWMGSRELGLGTTDLFRMSQLVLRTDRQEYRPMLLRSIGDSTQIEAEPRALEGDDLVIPKTATDIILPPDMGIDGPYAVRGARAFLFRVREQGTTLSTVETIVGLSSPDGHEVATSHVSYSVHASVTLVSLGGDVPSDGSDVADWIRASYEGRWTTRRSDRRGAREPWPLLGHAVRVALERCAPDLQRFARVFAFRPPMGHSGASLLLVETAATAGSSLDTFRTLLDDADLRLSFLAALRAAVASAPASLPCVGSPETPAQAEQSRRDALQVIDELELGGGAPPVRHAAGEVIGRVLAVDPGLPDHDGALLAPGTVLAPPGESVRWSDPMLCSTPGGAVEFGIILPFDAAKARGATESFGWRLSDPIDDLEALRRRCVRLIGSRTIGPDHDAMIERSVEDLRPVAEQLIQIADRAGLVSGRDRLRLFAGFVQTTRYELQRTGGVEDGMHRFGIQMPLETAFSRAGDCDSSSLLLVALLRAGRVAPAGMVLVETEDAGHAMAAVSIPPANGDHVVRTASGDLVVVECTDLHPVGHCAEEYVGRHVRVVAVR